MEPGIVIRQLDADEAEIAKDLIIGVAAILYGGQYSQEALREELDGRNIFYDMADIPAHYTDRGGLFLGVFSKEQLVGTGAVWPLDKERCELKRMWLLPEYWGRGIGYEVIQQLILHARKQGWRLMYLCTDVIQERAINFYHRVGFNDTKERQEVCGDGVSMVMSLE